MEKESEKSKSPKQDGFLEQFHFHLGIYLYGNFPKGASLCIM